MSSKALIIIIGVVVVIMGALVGLRIMRALGDGGGDAVRGDRTQVHAIDGQRLLHVGIAGEREELDIQVLLLGERLGVNHHCRLDIVEVGDADLDRIGSPQVAGTKTEQEHREDNERPQGYGFHFYTFT